MQELSLAQLLELEFGEVAGEDLVGELTRQVAHRKHRGRRSGRCVEGQAAERRQRVAHCACGTLRVKTSHYREQSELSHPHVQDMSGDHVLPS